MRLQIERDLLVGSPVGQAVAITSVTPAGERGSPPGLRDWAFGVGLLVVMMLDLGLAALERVRGRR